MTILDELQADVPDLSFGLSEIGDILSCAESCECVADLVGSLSSAIESMDILRRDMQQLLDRAKAGDA